MRVRFLATIAVLAGWLTAPTAGEARADVTASEMHQLLEREIPSLPAPAPGVIDPRDYLGSLSPRVIPVEGTAENGGGASLPRTEIYLERVGYLRVGRVDETLPPALDSAMLSWRTNGEGAVDGWVLDLRFAGGTDYRAALIASLKLGGSPDASLQVGGETLRAQGEARGEGAPRPLIVLVNQRTAEAAEALAWLLRNRSRPALVLGTNTAGRARVYREFEVPGGPRVRLAGDPVRSADGTPIAEQGLQPDLTVAVPPADEELYYGDEFRRVVDGRRVARTASQRMNEAELIRRRRGTRPVGRTPDPQDLHDQFRARPEESAPSSSSAPEAEANPVQDPVLGRALDLLDGVLNEQEGDRSKGDSR